MTNARSIKKELIKFHESGILVDDKYTVLRAIEAYRVIGENMKYVPEWKPCSGISTRS